MNRFLLPFLFILSFTSFALAQTVTDSITPQRDSSVQRSPIIHRDSPTISRHDSDVHKLPVAKSANDTVAAYQPTDSIVKRPHNDTTWHLSSGIPSIEDLNRQILWHHPYFGFISKPRVIHTDIKQFQGKEILFYSMILLLIIYALLRRAFPKYFNDLFRLFFRTTIKQMQVREQLMQTPIPALFLNIFFVITGSLYVSFLLEHFHMNPFNNFWLMALYCALALAAVYTIKYVGLKITGWLFNMKDAADAYSFIVFIVNKMAGLFLLPFLVLLAFTKGNIYSASVTLSWLMIGGILAYRFILTYAAVRKQVRVNPFHFFLYLCAFELAPLLLIYKGLLVFFHISA